MSTFDDYFHLLIQQKNPRKTYLINGYCDAFIRTSVTGSSSLKIVFFDDKQILTLYKTTG